MVTMQRRAFTCALLLAGALLGPSEVKAQAMADYTAYPNFLSKTVPPNILFIVDLGNQTIPGAYSGPNHQYPISFKSSTATAGQYASNVTFNSTTGVDVVAVNTSGVAITAATTAAPSDTFDSTKSYYGLFDAVRCYGTNSNSFIYGSVKATVSDACASDKWDGNFLNWMGMRKKDVAYQALVGGTSLPASSNTDGTANSLASEPTTGENGTNDTCNNNSNSCWRYVKFVPAAMLAGRVPTTLPNPAVAGTNVGDGTAANAGRFFGSGEGQLYVNDDATATPFDTANSNKYNFKVDLTTEPDVPSGTGNISDNCVTGDPNFAGHLVCYRRDHSLGLFQKLRMDNMHVGVMFVNAGSGQAGKMQFNFDDNFNSASITQIRNEHIQTHSPISEALYEGLCLFRKSQGPCYNNSGSSSTGYTTATGVAGDPFFFKSMNQTVTCCKSFVLMISPGIGEADGNSPGLQQPFGNLFTGTNIGVVTSGTAGDRLDDIAFYGQTHDIRDQTAAIPVGVTGTQTVAFYAVNSMGGAAGSTLLASGAKYGGFEDRNNNGTVDLTGQTCTYPAGSNLGTGTSASSAEWDGDQDCVPDTYFDASEGGDLEAQVNAAMTSILKRSASGTSVSVLATSSTGEGALYQAFYYPNRLEGVNEIKWTGYTQGLFLDAFGNLREDTDADGRLILQNDHIIKTRYDSSVSEVKVDRYADANGDGKADTTTPFETVGLKEIQGIWEAGKQLALMASSARKILTWVDTDYDGVVDGGEQIPFATANSATLAPYLRAGAAPFTADNLINFIRGEQVAGLRDRQVTVGAGLQVWKLGDPIDSTPTVVGAPKERYDLIYGDASYMAFFQQYRTRRQVAYMGANDGMLHAFNVGFYHRGDDPNTTLEVEHGWFTRTATDNSGGPLLGQELWGFIPYQLLPHLQWLARADYTHVYYVDLKPKVTDARIFTPDADHPNGWGTVLIGGFRMGGSCGACTAGTGAPPMTVTADFGSGVETRTFYSAYFVLDITNPEQDPKLLWVFTDPTLGLATTYPAVLRVNPSADGKTSNTSAKWLMVVGSGPTGYNGSSVQAGKMFAINLATGPGIGNSLVSTFPTSDANAFMGDLITLDVDLDFRVDTTYLGNVIKNGGNPDWFGKLYRLTTGGGNPNLSMWGIGSGSNRVPTVLLATFPSSGNTEVGPVAAAPTVTMDEASKLWVFFGSGRFYSTLDIGNTDTQYFFGVKDPVLTSSCTQATVTNCERPNLLDVSSATVCAVCTGNQVTGVSGVTSLLGSSSTTLQGKVQSMDGWVTVLPALRERALVSPTLLGGIVFFTTFIPTDDLCAASGTGNLYGLFYLTGSAFKPAVIGATTVGSETIVNRSIDLGTAGMASSMAVHIGGQGTGGSGATSGSGCTGRVTGFIQSSTGTLSQFCANPALSTWSRYISWVSTRE